MSGNDDDDLKAQRAFATLLHDSEKLFPRLVHKRKRDAIVLRQTVREADLVKVFATIEPFQEDPQLLDPYLKTFIPPLVDAYLKSISVTATPKSKERLVPLSHAICQILNLFCKVRGEKVVKGFLNNEPRYLDLILTEFESGGNTTISSNELSRQSIVPWTERYVLLLWLSHLMLAPFPLASMSPVRTSPEIAEVFKLDVPLLLPEISLRVLKICMTGLRSASKERGAAASLLVRLCIRPDMQELGLLRALLQWSLSFFQDVAEDTTDIHECLGVLSFLTGLVHSATIEEIGDFLAAIYEVCQSILAQTTLGFIKSSAVARKLIIKMFRNIVIHCLQADQAPDRLDVTTASEEVIEYLLGALSDSDTQVRYATSKALSIITMKLDAEMAGDVVEALLGSLNENVYWQGAKRNLSGTNALVWHGLTLTLSHLLYRRALAISQLPDLLNALLLALTFEQRSATGSSLGTNVRDAACFGIWALSRRYTTDELLSVSTSSVRASENRESHSIIQVLAIELLVVACLDPSGNIRRGSSAALQELVGRHPNVISEGISLVQVVDFHAVGLRERAMCEVSVKAGALDEAYWEALFENILEWRGTGSLDANSRLFAARAVGLLSVGQPASVVLGMMIRICTQLTALTPREVEERQGLVSALAAVVEHATPLPTPSHLVLVGQIEMPDFAFLWQLLQTDLNLEDASFTSPDLRPEFTASSFSTFFGALANLTVQTKATFDPSLVPIEELGRLFTLCLGRHTNSVLQAISGATGNILELIFAVKPVMGESLIESWLIKLENEASYNGLRWSGFAIALGAAYPVVASYNSASRAAILTRILAVLAFRCTSAVSIEARTVALRAIEVLLRNFVSSSSTIALNSVVRNQISSSLKIALNDYTVTERGDVGSLVRLEALSTTGTAWETGLLGENIAGGQLLADVLRLSFEKLDKVRLRASQVLMKCSHNFLVDVMSSDTSSPSSYSYFALALNSIKITTPENIKEAVCIGYISSAVTESWPTESLEGEDIQFSLCDFANILSQLLKKNLGTERVLLPLLEVLAFLLDMQILQRLISSSFNFRALLSYTQKAHFKSTHMHKLQLALDVYRGLGTIPATRADTITKLTSMLLHPFPRIRSGAAETLWMLTQEEALRRQDWSASPKSLKSAIERVKTNVSRIKVG